MLGVNLIPLDLIVCKGSKWSIPQALVRWRSLSKYCHVLTVGTESDIVYDPDTDGLNKKYLSNFTGTDVTIVRLRDKTKLHKNVGKWLEEKFSAGKGYDFLSWVGFATGIKALEDEDKWYCSEFPYWAFMENGIKLTNNELTFVYPSFFVESPMFEIIFDGVL